MSTLAIIQVLEDDLGKPVISAASAMMWAALRAAGVNGQRPGYGRLLARRDQRRFLFPLAIDGEQRRGA